MISFRRLTPALLNAWLINQHLTSTHACYRLRVWRENQATLAADEGGSWEVGVDWASVLPAWFRVLSATVGPAECAQRIATTLRCHYDQGRVKMLAVARRIATPTQRLALPKP